LHRNPHNIQSLSVFCHERTILSASGCMCDRELVLLVVANLHAEFFVSETPRGKVTDARKLNLIKQVLAINLSCLLLDYV